MSLFEYRFKNQLLQHVQQQQFKHQKLERKKKQTWENSTSMFEQRNEEEILRGSTKHKSAGVTQQEKR